MLTLLALLTTLPLPMPGAAVTVWTTDYYRAQLTPQGSLDFYALDGNRLVSGLPGFQARYFARGAYWKISGNVSTTPLIEERNDSIFISTEQRLGVVQLTYRFTLALRSPLVHCQVRTYYPQSIDSVFFETVGFSVYPESCQVLLRNQQLVPADQRRSYVSDKWTTRAARFGKSRQQLTLIGEDNLMGMRLNWAADHWCVTYDIDRDQNHPFFRNWDNFLTGMVYETLSTCGRAAGSSQDYYFRFAVGEEIPIIKRERQPDGYLATFVFTEHADCDGPLTTKAIAYGSSDTDTPIPGRGILGNGLTWTKSVFRWHTYGSRLANLGYYGLDRPDHKAVIDRLYQQGVEIALHTPTALSDSADTVGVALRNMAQWYRCRTWIDHGADFNRECLSKFGTYPESTAWYILDTIHNYGIEYVWQLLDMPGVGGYGTNLFVPHQTDFYPPILYPQPRLNTSSGWQVYLWPAFAPGYDWERDNHITPSAIEQLIHERGVDILHVYFCAQDTFVNRRRPCYVRWLKHRGAWPYIRWESDRWVDACLQYMADRQHHGLLRVPTLAQFADYLLQSDSVELRALSRRDFLVVNHSQQEIRGFSLSVSKDNLEQILLEGQPIPKQKFAGDDIIFWFDVPPQKTLLLTLITRENSGSTTTKRPEYH